jgi:hypothetical protein
MFYLFFSTVMLRKSCVAQKPISEVQNIIDVNPNGISGHNYEGRGEGQEEIDGLRFRRPLSSVISVSSKW